MSDTAADTQSTSRVILNAPEDGRFALAERNRNAVYEAYRAVEQGDMTKLVALLSPDVEFHEAPSLPYAISTKGIEATLAGVGGMFDHWSDLTAEIEELVATGDLVICYLLMTATSRATGKVYSGMTAETFRFRDGKIIEWRPIYWDTHEVRVVSGL